MYLYVFDSRIYNIESSALPCIIIFSNSENIATSTITRPRTQDRQLKVTIECYARATSGVDKLLDDLTAEIEELIITSLELSSFYKDCRLESTDITFNHEGDQPVALATLVYGVLYRIKENEIKVI